MAEKTILMRSRTQGTPPKVLMALRDVAKLPTADARRAELLSRLELIWIESMERLAYTKSGPIANPDYATALRVVEVADALLNNGEKQEQRRALVDMTIFKGKVAG